MYDTLFRGESQVFVSSLRGGFKESLKEGAANELRHEEKKQ